MRVPSTLVGDPTKPLDVARHSEYLARAINGKISYGANMQNPSSGAQGVQNNDNNMDTWKFEGNSGVAANTPFTLKHSLTDANGKPRAPICIVGQVTKDGSVIYADWTTWTNTTVTLKSTGANTAFRLIIA